MIDYLYELWSPGIADADHIKRVKETLAQPGALEASLGYYRAMLQFPLTHPEESQRVQFEKTTVPTLTVFGAHDPGHELSADEDSFYEAEHRLEVIPDYCELKRPKPRRLRPLSARAQPPAPTAPARPHAPPCRCA